MHHVSLNEHLPHEQLETPMLLAAELFGDEVHVKYSLYSPRDDFMPAQSTPTEGDAKSTPTTVGIPSSLPMIEVCESTLPLSTTIPLHAVIK